MTLALLLKIDRSAEKGSWQTAARMPDILFAVIAIPIPVPQTRIPLSHSPFATLSQVFAAISGYKTTSPANSNKTYTNKVEWNGNSAEQTTTVDKEVEKVKKSAEQLKDASGKLISAVRYKVVINPAAEDLLKNEDWLTLTDTMTIQIKSMRTLILAR